MSTDRFLRVNQLIKKELSQIILREFEPGSESLITLTRVETTPNLIESKIYVSVIPENKTKKIVFFLNKQVYGLQQELNHRLSMRPVPKIFFVKEKETARAGRVEEILEKIKKEEK